jgi:hypothetical protein
MYVYPRMTVIKGNGTMKTKTFILKLMLNKDTCSHAAMKDQ